MKQTENLSLFVQLECGGYNFTQSSRMYCNVSCWHPTQDDILHFLVAVSNQQISLISLMVLPRFQENHQVKSFNGCEDIGTTRGRPCGGLGELLRHSMSLGINKVGFYNFFIFPGHLEETGYNNSNIDLKLDNIELVFRCYSNIEFFWSKKHRLLVWANL